MESNRTEAQFDLTTRRQGLRFNLYRPLRLSELRRLHAHWEKDPALYALTRKGVVVATGPNIMRLVALIQPPDLCVIEAERLGWKIERQKENA